MRTKKEIMQDEIEAHGSNSEFRYLLEVLIDIRDVLDKTEITGHGGGGC